MAVTLEKPPTMTDYQYLLVDGDNRVATVALNRPKALNAISPALIKELVACLQVLDADSEVGCIVITGNDRAFAAGADIGAMAEKSAKDMHDIDLLAPWDEIPRIKTPLIAAVRGFALGGGCELAMMCDMIVAAESATFGQPEIKLGVMPGAGGTQRLTKAIGKTRAMRITLTGENFSAQQAYDWGLLSEVVPAALCLERAQTLAKTISEMPACAVRSAKQAINHAVNEPLQTSLSKERTLFYDLFDTADQKEGMTAFAEKRPAKFTHQ